MITQTTINDILSKADIIEVVTDFMKLEKKGVNYTGCCPFHNEATPSFSVNPAKQIYKCFGCGKGGGVVKFVMEHEKKSYPEAIEYLAGKYKVPVEYEDHPDPKTLQERKDKAKERADILRWAEEWYHKKLIETPLDSDVWRELQFRGYGEAEVKHWRLGFAPANDRNIVETIINKGWFVTAQEIGLVKSSNGYNFDTYKNRLMFPIADQYGACMGFGGRKLVEDKNVPKYINPVASDMYDKSNVLYGLQHAAPFIKKMGFAYLVEGYTDVISMHRGGACNTVAPCGTALTDQQCKLLKRFFNTPQPKAVILGDADDAGIAAMEKQVDLLLQHEYRVEVAVLPDGHDPESFIRQLQLKSYYETEKEKSFQDEMETVC